MGQFVKNHTLTQNGERIQCNTEDCVPIVVPGSSTSSSGSAASSSLTSLTQDTEGSTSSPATIRRRSTSSPPLGNQLRDYTETNNKNNKTRTPIRYRETCCEICQVGGRVHRKSRRRRSVSITGHTRKHFSRIRSGTSKQSGIEEKQYLCSLPERPKLRSMQREPRLQGLVAGNALVMQHFELKTLVT